MDAPQILCAQSFADSFHRHGGVPPFTQSVFREGPIFTRLAPSFEGSALREGPILIEGPSSSLGSWSKIPAFPGIADSDPAGKSRPGQRRISLFTDHAPARRGGSRSRFPSAPGAV